MATDMVVERVFPRLVGMQVLLTAPATAIAAALACVAGGGDGKQAVLVALAVAFTSVISSIVATFAVSRRLAVRAQEIGDVLDRAAGGDHEARASVGAADLLPALENSTNRMQENLRGRFASLQQNRDQLRTVLDSMAEGVVAVDRDQTILLVNHSICRIFRFQEAGALGRPIYELIRNPRLLEWVNAALANGEPAGGELEVVGASVKHLRVRVAGVAAPSATGAVVVVSDLSELRRLEAVRQEFVANASHELKTPLASIAACAETLIDGATEDPDACRHFLLTIQEQAARLSRLVQDMLSLTRLESDGLATELGPVPLSETIETCRQRHSQNATRKEIDLRIGPGPEDVVLFAESEAVEHILDNLLDNAIKYTNTSGTVQLRWRVENDYCVIDVEDTGIGIPQNQLSRVFERFYRVDRARSRELGGTGLGLSIVKHMTQAMDGSVTVSSRLGKGTVFSVRLNLYRTVAPVLVEGE